MKRLLLFISCFIVFSATGQTPVNFTVNDCSGNNHDLFTELNAGKVVVICWVMPCTNCTAKAKTAYNAVQSFSASNPGQVNYYVADDYGNTICADLQLYCDTSIALNIKTISNASVSMSPYGAAGMPKIVVLGGVMTHSVYFNQNGSAANNLTGIQSAISQATADILAGVKEISSDNFQTKISPNPSSAELSVSFELKQIDNFKMDIYTILGSKIRSLDNNISVGMNTIKINVEGLSNGTYFLKISNSSMSDNVKFIVNH